MQYKYVEIVGIYDFVPQIISSKRYYKILKKKGLIKFSNKKTL